MHNVTSHYSVNTLTPSSYTVVLGVDVLTHENYEQVILELGERIRMIMVDGMLESTEDGLNTPKRDKVPLSLSPLYLEMVAQQDEEKKKAKEAKDNALANKVSNAPKELLDIVEQVCKDDKARNVKNVEDKAINSLVGMVLKQGGKYDPSVVKICIVNELLKLGMICLEERKETT